LKDANKLLNQTIRLGDFSKAKLPVGLSNIALRYQLAGLQIHDGILAAGISIEWLNYTQSDMERADTLKEERRGAKIDAKDLTVEIEEQNGHHITIWMYEGIVNDLMALMDWDFTLINTTIPVTAPMLPEKSRTFLSTMCMECFFWLRVYSAAIPVLHAGNNSITFNVYVMFYVI
jgi:hypothetical protein